MGKYKNPLEVMPPYTGYPVYLDDNLPEFTLEPRRKHKRKRIQKKWIKRYGMIKIYNVYRIDKTILCHTNTFERIMEGINNGKKT